MRKPQPPYHIMSWHYSISFDPFQDKYPYKLGLRIRLLSFSAVTRPVNGICILEISGLLVSTSISPFKIGYLGTPNLFLLVFVGCIYKFQPRLSPFWFTPSKKGRIFDIRVECKSGREARRIDYCNWLFFPVRLRPGHASWFFVPSMRRLFKYNIYPLRIL